MTNPFEALENKLDRLEKILTNLGEAVIQNSEPQTEPTNKLVKIEQAATQTGLQERAISTNSCTVMPFPISSVGEVSALTLKSWRHGCVPTVRISFNRR